MADAKGERLRCAARAGQRRPGSGSRPPGSGSRPLSRPSTGGLPSGNGSNSQSKLVTYFQLLDKMNVPSMVRNLSSEDLQQVRHAASRILQHVLVQEKAGREQVIKNTFYVQSLLTSLEANKDLDVCKTIVNIFAELIGKTNTGSRCSHLVSQGATQVLFQLLVRDSKTDVPDEFILQIHYVLSKLSLKDRKFGVKARLSQALQVTLSFIRNHTHTAATRNLQPVLSVLKSYANNAINASYLGKNGAISHLFKIISNINKKNAVMTKTALDTLVLLVKSKSNSARAVGYGGVPILLQLYCDWHRLDSKNRHVNLRKSLLNILKHVTNLKSGRQAVIDADGVRVLYKTCEDIMAVRELESLIFLASLILRKCFPRQKLSANANRTTLLYKLPESEFHIPQGLSKDAAHLNGITLNVDTKEDDDSSLDNDDDLSSDDDPESSKPVSGTSATDRPDDSLIRRSLDDLRMYEQFFPEVLDIEVTDELSFTDAAAADLELNQLVGRSVFSSPVQGLRPSLHSMPNLPTTKYRHRGEADHPTDRSAISPAMSISRLSHQGFTISKADSKARELFEGGASAVNMKTGQPVFSLDFHVGGSSVRSKSKTPTLPTERRTKTKKGEKSVKAVTSFPDMELQIDPLQDEGDDSEFSAEEWVSLEDFCKTARKTNSVGRFNKVAYPDLHGSKPIPKREPLFERKFGVQRSKIFEDIDRMINPETLLNKTVYDFDEIVKDAGNAFHGGNSYYANHDIERLGKPENPYDNLHFNSHFESANLRKAIQVREAEYDLILCPDVNSNHHHQWFYFEVSNMVSGKPYRFNIINNEKTNSQFNFGMQPVMYSVQAAINGEPYWSRAGTDICYFKNHLTRSSQVTGGVRGKLYFTTTFSITFKYSYDVCYLAYHYPYTYTTLQCQLLRWQSRADPSTIYFKSQVLCQSVSGNNVNVLTITDYPTSSCKEDIEQFRNKPYIFLSCRVHPGESNASWVMKGTIEHLLSDSKEAQALRQAYIFKIVPMLNPDGVINGNHRCSLTAEDLNRRWMVPCPKLHPTIYHCKGILQFMRQMQRTPLVYCDYHGHSRRKNVFLYGCSPTLSWMNDDVDNPAVLTDKTEDCSYKTLPKVLSMTSPAFSLSSCSFAVEKTKESTARVVVWRQIGVVRSYTMESSYCGCDQGPYNGLHINISHLQHMGSRFADALLRIKSRHYRVPPTDVPDVNDSEDKAVPFPCDSSAMKYLEDEEYLDENVSEDITDDDEDDLDDTDL